MGRFVFLVLLLSILGIVSGDVCLSHKGRTRKCNILRTRAKAFGVPKHIARCVIKMCQSFPAKRRFNKKTGKSTLCIDERIMNKALLRCVKKGSLGARRKV